MGAVLGCGTQIEMPSNCLLCSILARQKAAGPGNYHIVQTSASAVDNQQISGLISASYNSNVLVLRVKGQIAGLGLAPGNVSAIGVLGIGPAAVINDISAAGSVVEHPVYEHPRPGRRLLCNLLYSRISDQPFL